MFINDVLQILKFPNPSSSPISYWSGCFTEHDEKLNKIRCPQHRWMSTVLWHQRAAIINVDGWCRWSTSTTALFLVDYRLHFSLGLLYFCLYIERHKSVYTTPLLSFYNIFHDKYILRMRLNLDVEDCFALNCTLKYLNYFPK